MSHEDYRTRLEAELIEVRNELKTIAAEDPSTGDWVAIPVSEDLQTADENVEADAVEEWDTRRAILVQLEIRHLNIKHALQKITDGTYGICELSGETIEAERLQANPSARTNIANRERENELPL
jgi:RNA polymerase-binding transcription factor DksA